MSTPMKCPACGWTKMVSKPGGVETCMGCGRAVVFIPLEQVRVKESEK